MTCLLICVPLMRQLRTDLCTEVVLKRNATLSNMVLDKFGSHQCWSVCQIYWKHNILK